jgi:iron complex transport system ATP-binding protein
VITLRDCHVSLGGHAVLHGIDFAAAPGEFVAICGPNGAGKTTLLRALAGLLPGGAPDARAIAYVAQGARSAWPLTAAEAVALGRIPWRDADTRAIDDALQACGVAQFRDRRVDHLSGGQARRVMLARALATGAPTLLLDEPVADLDPRAAHEIMALLAGLARSGRCVVAVLHAVELAIAYATRMVIVSDGRITADGKPDRVLGDAARAFGMQAGPDTRPRLQMPQQTRES